MSLTNHTPKLSLRWIIAGLCVLSFLTWTRFPVGYWSDDARDILAAKSILHGTYSNRQLPGHPPANFPLPGFPLLLAPFVLLVGTHWFLLKLLSLALSGGVVYLLHELFVSEKSPRNTLLAIALFAANPATVMLSSQVLADTAYLFLLLGTFYLYQKSSKEHLPPWILFSSSLLLVFTRPEGILAVFALMMAAILEKRLSPLRCFFGTSLSWCALLVLNYVRTGSISRYQALFSETLPALSHGPVVLLKHAWEVLTILAVQVILALSFVPKGGTGLIILAALTMTIISLVFFGLYRWNKERLHAKGLRIAVILYFLLHLGVHILWLADHPRYLWSLLPLALLFLFKAVPNPLLFAILFIPYTWQNIFGIQQTLRPSRSQQATPGMYQWVRTHTPTYAFFLAPRGAPFTLYTDRHSLSFLPASDPDEFRAKLLSAGISHVLIQPTSYLHVQSTLERDPVRVWQDIAAWIATDTKAFSPLYADSAEQVSIYAVKSDPKFQAAYDRYNAIVRQGSPGEQMEEIEEAIRIAPLPCLLNAFGVSALFSGKKQALAIERLMQAVQARPTYLIAWVNLARLYRQTGRIRKSRESYDNALRVAQTDERFRPWQNIILSEVSALK